jgi:hypothetical protein
MELLTATTTSSGFPALARPSVPTESEAEL